MARKPTARPDPARGQGLSSLVDVKRELAEQRRRAEEQARAAAEAERRARLEREAFARAVGPVTPLPPHGRATGSKPLPQPTPRQRELDEQAVLRESLSDEFDAESLMETDAALAWRRDGIGPDVLPKLRRGAWVVQGQLDLHGLTRDGAREALTEFLRRADRSGWRCVRVVHGKGIGSPGGQPVLKGKVRNWLVQSDQVLAFAQATGPDGGAGALIVLLDASTR
jgi:DNA-nicking Smr family endonuclease